MITGMKSPIALVVATLFVTAAAAAAQPVRATTPRRPALEQALRQRMATITQQRLELTDAQMGQLEQSNARFAPRHTQLIADERETRRQLRLELTSPAPNQQRVSDLMDKAISLQKQRVAIVEAEQRDLARFMSPVQRARYFALQMEFRRRAQELARQNGGRRPGPGLRRQR